jgi:hypothetical protein
MRRFGAIAAVLLLAGVLGGCTITFTYSPPTTYTNLPADGSAPASPTDTVSLSGQETVDYRVSMSAVSTDLFHAEADGPVTILVMDSGGQPIASSNNSTYFVGGLGATSLSVRPASSGLAASSVVPSDVCNGPCVLTPAQDAYYYVEVTNTSSSTVSVDLYFYGTTYGDSYEPGNDSRTGTPAQLTASSTSEGGAIETVGDVDYWKTIDSGSWQFDAANSAFDMEVYILDSQGNLRYGPYYSGQRIPAYGGWYYKVVSGNQRAGVAGKSAYYFSNYQ